MQSIAPLFKERYVICQEADALEIEISHRYGFEPIEIPSNLGIQEGLAQCAAIANTEFVLVMENDCVLLEPAFAYATLKACETAFLNDDVDYIKLGHKIDALNSRYRKYWSADAPPRKKFWGYVRPIEAKSCCANIVYQDNFPFHGTHNVQRLSDNLYVTSSKFVNWTNRAFIIRKSFFLEKILKFARENPAKGKVNGKPDLEKEMNCFWNRSWWRRQNFKVGLTLPGLFGHERLDRNKDDEKFVAKNELGSK